MVNNQNEVTMRNLYDVVLRNEVKTQNLYDVVLRNEVKIQNLYEIVSKNEVVVKNLYEVILKIDNKLDSSVEILNNKIDDSIKASEERMRTYIQTYVEKEFDDFAIIIGKSFAGSEERMNEKFVRIETRLDRIELSTPRELEKRIMVVEEDSDLHDLYFRGFRETLKVT